MALNHGKFTMWVYNESLQFVCNARADAGCRVLACYISAGIVHLRLVSTNDWEHAANTDLGVTNEFYGVGEFANNALIMMLD